MKIYDETMGRDIDIPSLDLEEADRALHMIRTLVMASVFNDLTIRDAILRYVADAHAALRGVSR